MEDNKDQPAWIRKKEATKWLIPELKNLYRTHLLVIFLEISGWFLLGEILRGAFQ